MRSLLLFCPGLSGEYWLEKLGCLAFSFTEKAQLHFFFSLGTILRIFYLALNTAFKTQSQPLTANNLEFVILKLQREFPSITTNEWEPHS